MFNLMGSKSDDGMLSTTCMTCATTHLGVNSYCCCCCTSAAATCGARAAAVQWRLQSHTARCVPTDHKGKPNFLLYSGVTPAAAVEANIAAALEE